jgi:hypothetical protein
VGGSHQSLQEHGMLPGLGVVPHGALIFACASRHLETVIKRYRAVAPLTHHQQGDIGLRGTGDEVRDEVSVARSIEDREVEHLCLEVSSEGRRR